MRDSSISDILEFWFSERMQGKWFNSSIELDREITERFKTLWEDGAQGELDHWQSTAEGALALVILLDQLPLNMFRDQALGYSTEQQAVAVARSAIEKGFDRKIANQRLGFLYMPFMHSENLMDQDISVQLFSAAGLESNARFAYHHREIIRRFGRFPHRNDVLERESTKEELQYLNSEDAFRG